MTLFDHTCRVVAHRTCGNQLKVLTLQSEGSVFTCEPGHFVMVDMPSSRFFFRRPLGVLDVRENGIFDLFYKVVGQGTAMMADFQPDELVKVLGPLGNTFQQPTPQQKALLIGGGIGIVPLYFMGKQLALANQASPLICLYGVRSQAELGLEPELRTVFSEPNQLLISTDDGSTGYHGNVCQVLEQQPHLVTEAQRAYVCGPTRMMQATVELLQRFNPSIEIQVSLEEHMPCGIGACTGCVVGRPNQLPAKVCVDGPIFQAQDILWQGLELPFPSAEVASCSRSI